jgi:Uncharacterized conserved protein
MKKLVFALSIAMFGVLEMSAQQSVAGFPTVTVTGTAEIFVVPDEVTFSAKVEKTGKTLAEAKQAHDNALARLISAARRFVTDEKDIKTDFLTVAEHFKRVKTDPDDDEYTNVFDGYKVSRSVTIKLRDISKFERALADLIAADVSNIGRVSFGTSKLRQYKDEARANAMAAAKEKATALADRIGQTIGRAIKIEEDADGYRSPGANYASNSNTFIEDGASVGSDTAIGTISVKAQVEVEFILN